MKIRWIIIIAGLFCYGLSNGQSLSQKGVPGLVNFTPAQFNNMGKVWGIASAPNGLLYFSSDNGLIEYDGHRWKSYKGSRGVIRSLLVANDSTIYSGSDMDFGIWRRNAYKQFDYVSIFPFKEGNPQNEEFWQVHSFNNSILFVSFHNLYHYHDGQLTKTTAPSKFSGSFHVDNTLYIADELTGLYRLNRFHLEKICTNPSNSGSFKIKGLYNLAEKLIVVTQSDGLWYLDHDQLKPYSCPVANIISSSQVFCTQKVGQDFIAYGTIQQGLIIADRKGNIIHQINRKKGLANNTVLSLYWLENGSIWLSMDYGLARIELFDKYSFIYDHQGSFGTGCTATLKAEDFYLGTNQGLYRNKWKSLSNATSSFDFNLIPGSQGQVWTIQNIDNKLFVGHDKGLFEVENNQLKRLYGNQGVWTVLPIEDYLLAGTYNGILILKKENNTYKSKGLLREILGSCTQLIFQSPNILWVNIPNFGIVRALLDEEMQPLQRTNYDAAAFEGSYPSIFLRDQNLVLKTTEEEYIFNEESGLFERVAYDFSERVLDGQLPSWYRGVALDDLYEFFPVYNGFALKFNANSNFSFKSNQSILIRSLEAIDLDTTILLMEGQSIPASYSQLKIELAFPGIASAQLWYRFDSNASWIKSENPYQLLIGNLKSGDSKLFLRTMNSAGNFVEKVIEFKVEFPLFRSRYAYAMYLILAIFFILAIHRWKSKLLKKQRLELQNIEDERQKEREIELRSHIQLLEKQQLTNENIELKQQVRSKTLELATKAKLHEDKIRVLNSLNEKLQALKKSPSKSVVLWKEIQQILDISLEAQDKMFEIQMDELHQEFFHKLKTSFSELTQNDLRLSAYLKIGLNTHEIAEMLNVQPSSAYISRSRLRKKLNLGVDDDLYHFLNRF